jgi:hypothetical protein
VIRVAAVLALLLCATTSCSLRSSREGVPIHDASLVSPNELTISLDICNPSDRHVSAEESDDTVTITVSAKRQGSVRDGCRSRFRISLQDPLGDRKLEDGTTGKRIVVGKN